MAPGLSEFSSLFYTPPPSPPTPTTATAPPAWMWPSCKHPRTQSLRAPSATAKTIASIFLDSAESSFANSSARTTRHVECASDSLSTESEPSGAAADNTGDAIVRGLRSDRLLFEPRAPSSSILEKKPPPTARRRIPARCQAFEEEEALSGFGGGVAVSLESADPYGDFRESMKEMVAAHGGAGYCWAWLEKMLAWYLGANGKDTHPAIITAFFDIVVCMAAEDAGGASGSSRISSFTLVGSEPAESSSAGGGHFSFGRR